MLFLATIHRAKEGQRRGRTDRLLYCGAHIAILTDGGLVPDVLEEDVEGLEELDAHVAAALLVHYLQEEGQHVPLQEEARQRIHICE